ncbi:MAG: YopX family protein [Gammaproteobacteria bacterium]|nr:YopX family protein [Gammaproteobacteria bacterium]
MDKIRYRVWNKEKECYFMFDNTIGFNGTDLIWCNPELFTGLLDKNSVDIFAGDVVIITALANDHSQLGATEVMNVFFFMGNACVRWENNETGIPIYPMIVTHTIEVISHIHQS